MMDGLYSLTLLTSLVAGALALLGSLIGRFPRLRSAIPFAAFGAKNLARAVMFLVGVALAALLLSASVHFFWGHAPGTAEPMQFVQFLGEHRAFFAAGFIALLAAALHFLGPRA